MPTRDTSIAAFRDLQHSDILGSLQARAYHLIKENPGKTANELRVIEQTNIPNLDHEYYENLDKRFSELERWNLVHSNNKRVCTISNKVCHIWEPTGRAPVKPLRRENKDKVLESARTVLKVLLDRVTTGKVSGADDLADVARNVVQKINVIIGGF